MAAVAVIALALLRGRGCDERGAMRATRPPWGSCPTNAVETAVFPGLYVATTRHDEPLERLAIKGLGFRSRVDVTVTTAGVALDLPGQPRIALTRDRLVDAAQATVAIDRVVERDGLTRVSCASTTTRSSTPTSDLRRPRPKRWPTPSVPSHHHDRKRRMTALIPSAP